MNKIENFEVFHIPEIDKKTKKQKSVYEISAASAHLHVMNENIRDKPAIFNNRAFTNLDPTYLKVRVINGDIVYEKKKYAKTKQELKKLKKNFKSIQYEIK